MGIDAAVQFHREAMEAADKALAAKLAGDTSRHLEWTRRAFELERQAADVAHSLSAEEPTLSVLHRSAATLAFNCGELDAAERLVFRALAGEPPEYIRSELWALLENVTMGRHLEVRGVRLQPGEFQFVVTGPAVGHGYIPYSLYIERVTSLELALFRTAERKMNRKFRPSGSRPRKVKDALGVYLSVPRAASFAVTFRIGEAQELFPEMSLTTQVVTEVVTNLERLNVGEVEAVQEDIQDPVYFSNFLALAKKIAPDGEDVTAVGFTLPEQLGGKQVALTTTGDDLPDPPIEVPAPVVHADPGIPAEEEGYLRQADGIAGHSEIALELREGGKPVRVVVPEGMMDDIVRPYWGQLVMVRGVRRGGVLYMSHIKAAK